MNKMIMNRLTMLAVTLMASIACFAQGKSATTIESGKQVGDIFDYLELKYKVLDNSAGYQVEVIGFADAFEADPTLFETSDEIKAEHTVYIPHYIGESTDVAVKVHVSNVADGALNTDNTDLAAEVTALIIDYVDNDKTQGIAMTIGANAFAALTSLATVESFIPGAKVAAIPASAFDTNVYKNATLKTPEKVMGKYTSKEGWKRFLKITDGSILLGDIDGNGSITALDVAKFNKAYKTGVWTGLNKDAVDMNSDGTIAAVEYAQFCKRYKEFY